MKTAIRFIKDYEVKEFGPKDPRNPKYLLGDEVEVSEASARHFISRGVAELTADSKARKVLLKKDSATEKGDADKTAAQDGDAASKPASGAAGSGQKGGKSL